MSDCDQSARLSCDERLNEIAAIFAKGVVRLHERAALPSGESPENPSKQQTEGLEVPAKTRLSVRVG